MYSVFKLNYMYQLEQSFKGKFGLPANIFVLPPIIKRLGLLYYVCFPVIESCENCSIKRPVGLICINKFEKIKVYNFNEYDFCSENNFYKEYYKITNTNFWPKKSLESEKLLRTNLLELNKIFLKTNLFLGVDEQKYSAYLNNIKTLFPNNYFRFYNLLQNNPILKITLETQQERNRYLEIFKQDEKIKEVERQTQINKNKNALSKELNNTLKVFIREDVMPSFRGIGSYSKLIFFNDVGKFLKKLDLNQYVNCTNPDLDAEELEKNKNALINKIKVEIIKIYSKSINNKYNKDVNADTLSKILIVFLNSLLIEEINRKCLPSFEQEITESKEIFDESINNVKIFEVKDTLEEFYSNLCNDYLESNKNNFSNLFHAYLFIFS